MRNYISKIVLFFAFSVFLTHDVLPHFHFDDHLHQNSEQETPSSESDHIILAHHIDEDFTVNKVLKIQNLTVLIKYFYVTDPLEINLTKEHFTYSDHSDLHKSNLIGSILKNRAPPQL